MDLLMNSSMSATADERKSYKWTALTRFITILFLSQVILGAANALLTLASLGQIDPHQIVDAEVFQMDAYFALYGSALTLIFILVLSRFVENRSYKSLGFTHQIQLLTGIKVLALTLLASSLIAIFHTITQATVIKFNPQFDGLSLIFFSIGLLIYTTFQEISFRGYLMNALAVDGKIFQAIWVNSLIQALLHIFNDDFSMVGVVNIFLFAALLSYLFYLSDDILVPILVNASSYIFFTLILGSDYQGLHFTQSFFLSQTQEQSAASLDQSLLTLLILIILVIRLHFISMNKVMDNDTKK